VSSAAAAVLATVAGRVRELTITPQGQGRWIVEVPGYVRRQLPVLVAASARSWSAGVFVLRGPEVLRHGDPAALHRHLLRRNLSLRLCRFALDADDDVVLSARMPVETLSADLLEAVLAELHETTESAFEALVHLGYPGVFPPLPRP
jgi:hypothetical protein